MNTLQLENKNLLLIPNIIFKNEQKIIGKLRVGRNVYWVTENGKQWATSEMAGEIEIACSTCEQLVKLNNYYTALNKKLYRCQQCLKCGTNNPFYGKKHSQETKNSHSCFMKNRFIGEKNHFYGKRHTEATKQVIAKKSARFGQENGFYGRTHTDENKLRQSVFMKTAGKRPREYYVQMGVRSSSMPYRKTTIEKQVESFLLENGINFQYNFIIPKVGQYDFKVDNILIEVNGTYWHADPRVYGTNKRPLNDRQQYKIDRDTQKKAQAKELGFTVVYIWEEDIKKNCFDAIKFITEE